MNDDAVSLIWALGALVLVASALAARRVPFAKAWKLALLWIAIFGALFLIFAFRDSYGPIGQRLRLAIDPEGGMVAGETLRIPMSDDGHFWVRGIVNGIEGRFLVDSGATTMVLSNDLVREAGIDRGGFPVEIRTANGTVFADRVRVAKLSVGPISREDIAAVTAPQFGEVNVIGMNFLSTLSAWGVEGRTLVLTP